MIDYDIEDYLTLAFTPHIGSVSFLKLLNAFHDPSTILSLPFKTISPFLEKPQQVFDSMKNLDWQKNAGKLAIEWVKKNDASSLITLMDQHYPLSLAEGFNPPPVLFAKGNTDLLDNYMISIVGSRKATPQGIQIATKLAKEISMRGISIISGMAEGIDTAAHLGALTEAGSSIAIIGTGIDRVYPAKNFKVAHQIAEKGLILSEFPLGTAAHANHFPQRNRIIAALGFATIVVEASLHSGSLITARLALDMGKDVMAVPGSIYNHQAKGTHKLIKDGAKLIETIEDVLEEYSEFNKIKQIKSHNNPLQTQENSTEKKITDTIAQSVLKCIGTDIIHPDQIISVLQFPAEEVLASLIELELNGDIKITSGGRYQRIKFN